MEQAQQAELDQQVAEVMQALEAAGEPSNVESVARVVRRRTADVLAAMKRLTGGPPAPDEDTDPEDYPAVVEAARKVAAITAARQDAEQVLTEQETLLARAELAAAEALADGREPLSTTQARQQVLTQTETLHLLTLAERVAKARYDDALSSAQAQHQQAVWHHFQALLTAHLVAARNLVETWEPLREYCAQHGWAFGLQPFNGTMQTMGESWVPHVEALLVQTEPAPGGGIVVPGGMPRPY